MSIFSRAEALLVTLARDPREQHRLFARHSRTLQQLEAGEDVYLVMAEGSRTVRRLMRSAFGQETAEAMARLSQRWRVTPEQARAFARLIRSGEIIGSHGELIARKAGGPLGQLLESDHIIEQRIHRMLRDGVPGFTARSSGYAQRSGDAQRQIERNFGAHRLERGERIDDALAILVPANEVAAYRMTRQLPQALRAEGIRGIRSAAPWVYIHQGLGSKTQRMAQMIPYRLEGELSYQQLFDASRWVVCYELGLPSRRGFQQLLLEDFLHSAAIGLEDDLTADLLRRHFLGGRRYVSPERLEQALRESLTIGRLRPQDFLPPHWPQVHPLFGPLDVAERARREIDEAVTATTR